MLDGAGIKAAREAVGMSQTELAEKCGTRQQTIEKIESGKVKRTSYLPEIHKALDGPMTGITPALVLRTILCANPTAEQIETALAANGFKIVPVAGNFLPTELAVDDTVAFVKEIMTRRGITSTELAHSAGLSASTLNRWLRSGVSGTLLSVRTLRKIKEWDRAAPEPQLINQA